ncbi:MAG TPA: RNA 3'-terminal phosphate cyclase [Dissulfurispiraceae bacterium]|nr:RNA 3'-terminal phosphate cyclase [Dissulfurispiraceae bacterium]
MIEIDGSYGEGGGQILRTALSLSCLFQQPFRLFNLRKRRIKPGIMPQHLTAIHAAQHISRAEVKGDTIGSVELIFLPRSIRGDVFSFDIGTAGSTSLVLQTLLPAFVGKRQRTIFTLRGGTHVPFSPSYHYLSGVFAPLLERLGIRLDLSIESYGFYPKGGGVIRATLYPTDELKNLTVMDRGRLIRIAGHSGIGNLPLSIAERQRKAALDALHSRIGPITYPSDIELIDAPTPGQGTFIYLQADAEYARAGFTSLGKRGKRAETVGEEVAAEFAGYYASKAALDSHAADQVVLYLSLCSEQSRFTTSCVTTHLTTNLWAIGLFHSFRYSIEESPDKVGTITVNSERKPQA